MAGELLSSGWPVLVRLADLDRLQSGFGLLARRVGGALRAHDGRRGRRLTFTRDGALLRRSVLHDVEAALCERRCGERNEGGGNEKLLH